MTLEEMAAIFEAREDEFLNFDAIPEGERLSQRQDMHAFLLLDSLVTPEKVRVGNHAMDMICGAEHDQIFLQPTAEDVADAASEADIINLIRCGVMYDAEDESFSMFV